MDRTDEDAGSTTDVAPLFSGGEPDRRHWSLAVAAGMASFLDASVIVALGVGLALIGEEYGLGAWGLGALSATLTFSIGVGALLGGRVADLVGRLRAFTVYILVYAVGMAAMALSPSAEVLFAGVVVAGLAAGADLPTSIAVVSERSPARAQGRLVSVTQVMWVIGIAVTQVLGFALSGLGLLGIRLVFGELAVLAVVTFLVRRYSPSLRSLEADAEEARSHQPTRGEGRGDRPRRTRGGLPLRTILTTRAMLVPLLLTMGFYVAWNLVANTFGQFQPYFLIEAAGASQTTATGVGAAVIPLGVIASLLVVRLMDTRWRTPVLVVGLSVQAVAMVLLGFGAGVLAVYVVAIALYQLGNNAAGEAIYKVWTRESLPVEARSTVQGLTLAVGRFAVGFFALATPTLIQDRLPALLAFLVVCVLVALALGLVLVRHMRSRGLHPGTEPPRVEEVAGGS
ncbi:MFS transporter [uncultured Pseudokineococcus sp.]|uniref:MFS transporter n=1 Tax=uncultured Pseudokineococcus sp. TaxID=1642928 RepID=UPI00260B476B|nr:MFS transporter [uncultured Pseudokineococcus sp.]